MAETKIIFLDIDGVLVTPRSLAAFHSRRFDPVAVKMVVNLCEQTNAKLVISSSWRKLHSEQAMVAIMEANGISANHLYTKRLFTPIDKEGIRGREILSWLKKEKMSGKILIVDDDDDFFDFQKTHFLVQTNGLIGMTHHDFDKCLEILS